MDIVKGYGVIIRNTPTDVKNTVVYQELTAIAHGGESAVIDVVRADAQAWPNLENLINSLSDGDRIDMYSIDTLLQGNKQRAVEYYSAIINKGIGLLIFDFSGAVARLSPFSTYRFGDRFKGEDLLVKKNPPYDMLIADFCEYIDTAKPKKNSGYLKTEKRMTFSQNFKDIYFAYESYQLDRGTTLKLMGKYCGVGNKVTFGLMCEDYERTLEYVSDLADYVLHTPEILNLPKRCGGLPEEYTEILNCASTLTDIPEKHMRIEAAMTQLGFIGGYEVFKRWELVAQNKPKPRKPVLLNFPLGKEYKLDETK